MFDFPKMLNALSDLDSRFEQIANQQRVTNGLLALLSLQHDRNVMGDQTSELGPYERTQLIALVRTAFNDKNRPADQGMRFDAEGTLIEGDQS